MAAFSLARLQDNSGKRSSVQRGDGGALHPLEPSVQETRRRQNKSQMTSSSQIPPLHPGDYLGIEAYSKHCARFTQQECCLLSPEKTLRKEEVDGALQLFKESRVFGHLCSVLIGCDGFSEDMQSDGYEPTSRP